MGILSDLYQSRIYVDEVSSYKAHTDKFKFKNVSFLVKLEDIPKVEKINNVTIVIT